MVTESRENYTLLPLKVPHFSKTIFAEWGQKNQRIWDRALYIGVFRFGQQIHEFSDHKIQAKTTKSFDTGKNYYSVVKHTIRPDISFIVYTTLKASIEIYLTHR